MPLPKIGSWARGRECSEKQAQKRVVGKQECGQPQKCGEEADGGFFANHFSVHKKQSNSLRLSDSNLQRNTSVDNGSTMV